MTNSTLKDNGHLPRKTLATQLDRLDEILDGLADNLNDAVAGAAREAVLQVVRQAVQEAVHDALAFAQPPQPSPVPQPVVHTTAPNTTWKDRMKAAWNCVKAAIAEVALQAASRVRRCWGWGLEKLQKLLAAPRGWIIRLTEGCRQAGGMLAQLSQLAWQHRKLVGVSLGVGLLAGLGSYLAGPVAAAFLTGLSTATLAAGGRATRSLWRLLGGAYQA